LSAPRELYLVSGDREERVLAEKVATSRYRVSLGDRVYDVDAVGGGVTWSLLVGGRQCESTVIETGSSSGRIEYSVSTGLDAQRVEVLEPLAYLTARRGRGQERDRTGVAKAYMPGRVVSFLVQEGEVVAQGQSVLVLEAMKMENEIASEAAGIVTKIYVEKGAAVEAGDPLFEVSPRPDSA
jgi:pyruvate carboxylase subunit B